MNHRILFAAATALYFATVPALTGTSIYVSNQTSGQVNFYDVTSGALQGTLGTYNSPKGLGVDIFGNLYIAASGEDRIYRNTTTGTQTTFLVQPNGSSPVSTPSTWGATPTFPR